MSGGAAWSDDPHERSTLRRERIARRGRLSGEPERRSFRPGGRHRRASQPGGARPAGQGRPQDGAVGLSCRSPARRRSRPRPHAAASGRRPGAGAGPDPVRAHARLAVHVLPGAAAVMAADLARTPVSGFRTQTCGDAHLSNFGLFASAERTLVFDINDFDETLPGPWEWDVKRLVASFAVAGRQNGFTGRQRHRVTVAAAAAYRMAMRDFAETDQPRGLVRPARHGRPARPLARDSAPGSGRAYGGGAGEGSDAGQSPRARKALDGGRRRTSHRRAAADGRAGGGPVAGRVRGEALPADASPDPWLQPFAPARTQAPARPVPDGAHGPQGRRCGKRRHPRLDPADARSRRCRPAFPAGEGGPGIGTGEVRGREHLRQSRGARRRRSTPDADQRGHLPRRRTGSAASTEGTATSTCGSCATGRGRLWSRRCRRGGWPPTRRICGWTLARAHARSGDRIAIAAYLGSSDRFDQAVADFAESYADLNESDFSWLQSAAAKGLVRAEAG